MSSILHKYTPLQSHFLVVVVCFYLCVKGDERTRYPAAEYPTCGEVESHLRWVTKTPAEANFSLSARQMTLNSPRSDFSLEMSSQ